MTLESWSKGDDLSLVRVIQPKRDAGNATLLDDNSMWAFAPRINRIIKVPALLENVAELDGQRLLQQGHRQVHRPHRPVRP